MDTGYRREMLALSQSIRHFHEEIAGRHLVCFTDHLPIVQAFKAPDAQNHDIVAQNHLNEIAQWTSDIRFVAGKSNQAADAFSRPDDVPMGTAYSGVPNKRVVPNSHVGEQNRGEKISV